MAQHRDSLPQLGDHLFLTDTGLETTLIFLDGYELPHFAAFTLLGDSRGRDRLDRYFREHLDIAEEAGTGFVLESATWRASPDWGSLLGYSAEALAEANRAAVQQLVRVRSDSSAPADSVVISGCLGPRGDGYDGTARMSAEQARDYHSTQVETFAGTEADMVNAMTITYPDEAVGLVRAAEAAGMPVAVSFTVEVDGRLPDGTPLAEAIDRVDDATGGVATYFGVNCAHPTHFADVLEPDAGWAQRLRSVRVNASRMSHAELDSATTLDAGDPLELAGDHFALRERLPSLRVIGGCCGTDLRHLRALAATLSADAS